MNLKQRLETLDESERRNAGRIEAWDANRKRSAALQERIDAAIAYCLRYGTDEETRDDAAEIYSNFYDEFMAIREALKNL